MARGESFDYDYDTGSYADNPVQVTRYRQNIQRYRDYGKIRTQGGPLAQGQLKGGIAPSGYKFQPPSAGVRPDFYRDAQMRNPNQPPLKISLKKKKEEETEDDGSGPATPPAGSPRFGTPAPAGGSPAPAPAGGGRRARRRGATPAGGSPASPPAGGSPASPPATMTTGTTGAVPPPPSTPLITVPPAYGPITTPPSATPPPPPTSPLAPPSATPPPPPSSPLSTPPATTPPAAPPMAPPRTSPTIETSPEVRERQQRAREARARREGGAPVAPAVPNAIDDIFRRLRQSPAAQAWKEQSAQTQQQRRSMFPETNRPTPSTSQPVTTPPTNRTTTRPSKKGKSAIGDVGKRLIAENWKEISKGWLD